MLGILKAAVPVTALLAVTLVVGVNVNASSAPGSQNEVDVAIDPTNPQHLIAGSNDLVTGDPRARMYESFNGGATWTHSLLSLPAGFDYAADPAITFDRHGNAFYAFIAYSMFLELDLFVARKSAGSSSWGTPVRVPNIQADKEFIVADRSPTSPCVDSIYVAWDNNEQMAQTLRVSRSSNGGASFAAAPKVNDTGTSVIGASPAVGPQGHVYVAWMKYDTKQLIFDRSTDCGATWGTDTVVHSWALPTTGLSYKPAAAPNRGIGVMPHLAVDLSSGPRRGRIYLAYNDASAGAGIDVFVRHSDDGGATWSAPLRVNDDGLSAPNDEFLPRIAVDPSTGHVHVAYLDTRGDATRRKVELYVSRSTTGASFEPSLRVSSSASDQSAAEPGSMDFGEYLGLSATGNQVVAVWTDNRSGDDELYFASVESALTITTSTLPTGFVGGPYAAQLTAAGGQPPYTWTATALPPSLLLGSTTGAISGTPASADVRAHDVTVQVKDAAGVTVSRMLTLTVELPPLTVFSGALPDAIVGTPYAASLVAVGGTAPYQWTVLGLPAGLIGSTSGAVEGTATDGQDGARMLPVTVTDAAGASATRTVALTVRPGTLVISTTALPGAREGETYSPVPLQRTGGRAPFRWGWAPGFVPPGAITLTEDGVLRGVPATGTAGVHALRLVLTDGSAPTQTAARTLELRVSRRPVAVAGEDRVVDPGVVSLSALGSSAAGGQPLSYLWTAPEGVVLSDPTAAEPSATLTRAGPYTFTLVVRSGDDASAPSVVRITVRNVPPVPHVSAPLEAVVGERIRLSAEGSTDANGDGLTFAWSQLQGPVVTFTPASGPFTELTPTQPGLHVLRVVASDGVGTAASDVTVSVREAPAGCGCGGAAGSPGWLALLLGLAASLARHRRCPGCPT